ncbi:hypothetical protein CDO73_02845 [Saccharibacillus sp. O23]|uniref:hypothetical protein n=1 Tax=Saccharibacillus sp. O23 TaxID=2009338 RepID=UPI000B4E8167|nr:hypothetical protein [Saccharibacillus sp. O23]OWR32558.1 hypothetical protein CDO73_02845 [Saccharibacillus sp. O23]
MQLIGQEVEHVTYGQGQIVQNEDKRIEVNFSGETENKKFMYPDAFEQFLSMTDAASQEKVLKEVELLKEARQANVDRMEREHQEGRAAEAAAKKTRKSPAKAKKEAAAAK